MLIFVCVGFVFLNLPCHQLKQEVEFKPLYASADGVTAKGHPKVHIDLTKAQWRIVSVWCKVLKPFEVATREVSSDTASLSQVIPLICLLQKQLEKLEELKHMDYAK